MKRFPDQPEIDNYTLKLIIGVIAISLPIVTNCVSDNSLTSISAAYHDGNFSRDYFVGSLFAIFALFIAYNGLSRTEMWISKIGALAAVGIAVFPCKCKDHVEIIPGAHGVFAAILFIMLAIFCYAFRKRNIEIYKHKEANRRNHVYEICGMVIILSIAIVAIDMLFDEVISEHYIPMLTFFAEFAALLSFGISWLTASHMLPFLTSPDERKVPFQIAGVRPN